MANQRDLGSYFILYDFVDTFNKENATLLAREQYHKIMEVLFRGQQEIEHKATLFQVRGQFIVGWIRQAFACGQARGFVWGDPILRT